MNQANSRGTGAAVICSFEIDGDKITHISLTLIIVFGYCAGFITPIVPTLPGDLQGQVRIMLYSLFQSQATLMRTTFMISNSIPPTVLLPG